MSDTEVTVPIHRLAERVRAAGGRALLIGGAVRDRLLGVPATDYDVEIYGLSPERVAEIAREVGETHDVGKAFGVLELRFSDASTVHVSLPRREAKVAPGHRGFAIDTDPHLAPEEAARRRDFTINAIAEDPLTGEILDPFRGRGDLAAKVLRVVDPATFADDPLRVLRGAVFTAQFELTVLEETTATMRRTVPSLRELPRERVGEEWRKLLLRPVRPSSGLRLLMDWGVMGVLHPEFSPLARAPQNPRWHPEGDVWTHTLMAVDEAAHIVRSPSSLREAEGDEAISLGLLRFARNDSSWLILLATLCHDLGKVATTRVIGEIIRSPGHDVAGVEPTRRFLRAIAADRRTIDIVVRLVREHLQPLLFFRAGERGATVPDGVVRALARRLRPATIALLTLVADADHGGRGPFHDDRGRTIPAPAAAAGSELREHAQRLSVLHGPPEPILRGADLVALGVAPGPAFGILLRRAEELRDEQGATRDDLLLRMRGARSADEALARLR